MSPDRPVPPGLARVAFPAMATEVTLLVPEASAADALLLTGELFATWETTLTRFRPGSELSRLNAAAGRPVPVGSLLFEVVQAALDAARATRGLFDPTILRGLERLGYDRTFAEVAPDAPATGAPAGTGAAWRGVRLDRDARTITLPAGTGIDLGGIAKGMAVDAAVARLATAGISPLMVDAGGDLRVLGSPPGGLGWPVDAAGRGTVTLTAGALATSGIARRQWVRGGRRAHHLLDPRTGAPATTGLWSVTVAAGTCAQAEVAAKTAFLLGPAPGVAFLEAKGLAGLLVPETGRAIAAGAWPMEVAA